MRRLNWRKRLNSSLEEAEGLLWWKGEPGLVIGVVRHQIAHLICTAILGKKTEWPYS